MRYGQKNINHQSMRKGRWASCLSQAFGRISSHSQPVGARQTTYPDRQMPRHRKSHWRRSSVRRAATGYRLGISAQYGRKGCGMNFFKKALAALVIEIVVKDVERHGPILRVLANRLPERLQWLSKQPSNQCRQQRGQH